MSRKVASRTRCLWSVACGFRCATGGSLRLRTGARHASTMAAAVAVVGSLMVSGITASPPPAAASSAPAISTYVYVANSDDETVSVVDPATNSTVTTISFPRDEAGNRPIPYSVVASPDNTRVYVTVGRWPESNVYAIDTATAKIVGNIPVGSGLYGMAIHPLGSRLYVTDSDADTVQEIALTNNSVVATIGVGHYPLDVAVSPDGASAYVVNWEPDDKPGTVSVVDTASNAVIKTITVDYHPVDVAFSPDGSKAYVVSQQSGACCSGQGSVTTIDTATTSVTGSLVVGENPNGLAVSPDGSRVYVTVESTDGASPGTLRTIDAATNTILVDGPGAVGDTAAGVTPWSIALNRSGSRAYLSNNGDASVTVVDTTTVIHDANGDPAGFRVMGNVRVGRNPLGLAVVSCASTICDNIGAPRSSQLADPAGLWNDNFGSSVAISGNTAVVGVPGSEGSSVTGSAYIYVKTNDEWLRQAELSSSDGQAGDLFGASVAISNHTVVVGAPHDTTSGGSRAGSVYVFVRNGTTWYEQGRLTAPDGVENDWFGTSVDVDGDRAVIGAIGDGSDVGADYAGSAYVFQRSNNGTWSEQARLTAPDRQSNDVFGKSVAISGISVVIGAPQDLTFDQNGNYVTQGSAHVFSAAGGPWRHQAKLIHADPNEQRQFGSSVDIDRDRLVVGAPYNSDGHGAAYVFVKAGARWAEQAELTASDPAFNPYCAYTCGNEFGFSVAISGRTIVAGARYEDTDWDSPGSWIYENSGSAYVFEQTANGTRWANTYRLRPPIAYTDDQFGHAVALSQTTAVVGAPFHDIPGGENQGLAYIFAKLNDSAPTGGRLLND